MELFRYGRDYIIVHVRGVSWEALRIPPLWHRCTVDSYAFIWRHLGVPPWVQRCRCGARRAPEMGEALPKWLDRNSRRKRNVFRYLPTG